MFQEVESSFIAGIRFIPLATGEHQLHVHFRGSNGEVSPIVSVFEGVPEYVVGAMVEAPSVGRYFNANIRNEYPVQKILVKGE